MSMMSSPSRTDDDADHQAVAFAGADVADALAAAALLAIAHRRATRRRPPPRPRRRPAVPPPVPPLRPAPRRRPPPARRRPCWRRTASACRSRSRTPSADSPSGSATTMPTTSSPCKAMPLTPRVLRPMARASASSKRMAMPLPRAQQHLVARLRQGHADQRVALVEADADDAARLGPAVVRQRRLLHHAAARRHEQTAVALEAAHRDDAGDLLVRLAATARWRSPGPSRSGACCGMS